MQCVFSVSIFTTIVYISEFCSCLRSFQIAGALASKKLNAASEKALRQIVSDIYFYAPLKHPLRSTTSRALHRESATNGDLVTNALWSTISESDAVTSENLSSDNIDMMQIVQHVTSLIGCFENLERAIAAILLLVKPIFHTISRIIERFMKIMESNDKLSPARRSHLLANLHNAIRIVLFAAQRSQNKCIDADTLGPIYTLCWKQLLEKLTFSDLPIDTKVNCAIVKVYFDRFNNDAGNIGDHVLQEYQRLIVKETSESAASSKKLFFGVAIINTMSEKDHLNENYCVALRLIVEHMIDVGVKHTMDSNVMMTITRGLLQFSRKTLSNTRKSPFRLTDSETTHLQLATKKSLNFVWLNVDHSSDCVRYAVKDLLKSLLRLGHEKSEIFEHLISDSFAIVQSSGTNSSLSCLMLDNLSQILRTERILREVPNIRDAILEQIFNDCSWSTCYERLMITNSWEIGFDAWCDRWILPLILIDDMLWNNDHERTRTIRNLFERALKAKPEVAEFILAREDISIEIYLFVLWTMRKSGRKLYSPQNYHASSDAKLNSAKTHQTDEVRILAFRVLTDCHKLSERFSVEDLNAILEFFKYNCNVQSPTTRQEIISILRRSMERIECGYLAARKSNTEEDVGVCEYYVTFLHDLIDFCANWCMFDTANFGRRTTGLTTLHHVITTWQKLVPDNHSIYTEQLWTKLQQMLADTYEVNRNAATTILSRCHQFYPQPKLLYDLNELKRLITIFRPYDAMAAAQYLVFCSFTSSYFANTHDVVVWCEQILDEGLRIAEQSLIQMARYNSLYGTVLCIRQLLNRVDFARITDSHQIAQWRSFFQRMIPRCKRLTDVAAPIINSSAPEGHLPENLNDESHFSADVADAHSNRDCIKITAQMILVCAWRTVRETALLLGEIALRIPITACEQDCGLLTVGQLLQIGKHFQLLLAETKHRGAFEQSFLGFSNLCLRLWRTHETELHSYPMQLVQKIAAAIAGENVDDDTYTDLNVSKLCITRRSAGIPFMIQAIVASEVQVSSNVTLTFSMGTFLDIARQGAAPESRTHALNILRALFK